MYLGTSALLLSAMNSVPQYKQFFFETSSVGCYLNEKNGLIQGCVRGCVRGCQRVCSRVCSRVLEGA